LQTAANLADQSLKMKALVISPTQVCEAWDDGFPAHAPVGQLDPNRFGMHDILGNVWEWCRDAYFKDAYGTIPAQAGDGFRSVPSSKFCVIRGSGWNFQAKNARSAFRGFLEPKVATPAVGIRAVRAIQH
jgi:formylglycine-generating enzyme required for sulfatase activity